MIDSIHCRMPPSEPKRAGSLRRSGRSSWPPQEAMSRSNSSPAKPLAGDDPLVGRERSLEQFRGNLALGSVGGRELERDRHPVWGAEQVQAEAPEVAGMGGAVAVGGVAGRLGALDRLTRLCTGHRGVEQAQPAAERGRQPGDPGDETGDLGCERAHALVVARLARDEEGKDDRAGAWRSAENAAP